MFIVYVYLLYRQLQDLILIKQQALDECKALKQNAEASDQKNFELEERNLTLENELSKSCKNLVIIQGTFKYLYAFNSSLYYFVDKLEYATKQHEAYQSELKLEQKQTSLLKAEINTLK